MSSSPLSRAALLSLASVLISALTVSAAEPTRVVFKNGRSIPLSSVSIQGTNIVVNTASDGFNQGQTFPIASADHIYGDKPEGLNAGISLLLSDKPMDALKLLEPIVASQKVSATISGNYWVEAARATLVAYAATGNTAKCNEIGKEISDATPEKGNDPFVALGKVILLPTTTKPEDREVQFRDLTNDSQPADVAAYASFFRGKVLKNLKRDDEALEAYITVSTMFPTGGLVINAAAEFNAAEILAAKNRRSEAVALFASSSRQAAGTALGAEANKRLESLK